MPAPAAKASKTASKPKAPAAKPKSKAPAGKTAAPKAATQKPKPTVSKPPAVTKDGVTARPRGRPPTGKEWDYKLGTYVDSGTAKVSKKPLDRPVAANGAKRPRGMAPAGKVWDYAAGNWKNK